MGRGAGHAEGSQHPGRRNPGSHGAACRACEMPCLRLSQRSVLRLRELGSGPGWGDAEREAPPLRVAEGNPERPSSGLGEAVRGPGQTHREGPPGLGTRINPTSVGRDGTLGTLTHQGPWACSQPQPGGTEPGLCLGARAPRGGQSAKLVTDLGGGLWARPSRCLPQTARTHFRWTDTQQLSRSDGALPSFTTDGARLARLARLAATLRPGQAP